MDPGSHRVSVTEKLWFKSRIRCEGVCELLNAQADGLLALESCMCLFGLDADKMPIMDKNRLVLLPLPLLHLVSAIWHVPVLTLAPTLVCCDRLQCLYWSHVRVCSRMAAIPDRGPSCS